MSIFFFKKKSVMKNCILPSTVFMMTIIICIWWKLNFSCWFHKWCSSCPWCNQPHGWNQWAFPLCQGCGHALCFLTQFRIPSNSSKYSQCSVNYYLQNAFYIYSRVSKYCFQYNKYGTLLKGVLLEVENKLMIQSSSVQPFYLWSFMSWELSVCHNKAKKVIFNRI